MEYSKADFNHLGQSHIDKAVQYFLYHNSEKDKQFFVADITRLMAIAILQNCTYEELKKCRLSYLSAKDFFNDNHKTHKMIEVLNDKRSKRVMIVLK
jgi:hypothetical protein